MRKFAILVVILLLTSSSLFSQVGINTDGSLPDSSAGLDVKFDNKGFLPPRLSLSQIQAIPNPANGLLVFCSTDNKMYMFISASNQWKEIALGTGTICVNPVSPGTGTHVPSPDQIIWNWNGVSGAQGYKWNTINDFSSATDIGATTTKTETGLNPGIIYTRFLWAYDFCGPSLVTILTQESGAVSIGQTFGGGKVFYIDNNTKSIGQHGLIVSPNDIMDLCGWGCVYTLIGTSTAIGSGQANTTAIANNGCSQAGDAAHRCYDWSGNGYNDWFLPSKDELAELENHRPPDYPFGSWYWSSSEYNFSSAWNRCFGACGGGAADKSSAGGGVRCIRAF